MLLFWFVVASASAFWWVTLMLPPICFCSASLPHPQSSPLPLPAAVWFCVLFWMVPLLLPAFASVSASFDCSTSVTHRLWQPLSMLLSLF